MRPIKPLRAKRSPARASSDEVDAGSSKKMPYSHGVTRNFRSNEIGISARRFPRSGQPAIERRVTVPSLAESPKVDPTHLVLAALKSQHDQTLCAIREAHAKGEVRAAQTALALSNAADRMIAGVLSLSRDAVTLRLGEEPGQCIILALGKLGGRELNFKSDLDLMLIYAVDEGCDPQAASLFYEKVAQCFIRLMSNHEVGRIYDVDMRLRPYGADGPLAVSASAFERYYQDACWTWELMALTRGRVVAGNPGFGEGIEWARNRALRHRLGLASRQILIDAAEMRRQMEAHFAEVSFWDVKRTPGGLIDIEFLAQALQLCAGTARCDEIFGAVPAALGGLADDAILPTDVADLLSRAWRYQFAVLMAQSAQSVGATAPEGLDVSAEALQGMQRAVRDVFQRRVSGGPLAHAA